jgi:Rod binding domain-containing protein
MVTGIDLHGITPGELSGEVSASGSSLKQGPGESGKLKEAAQEFEALLLAQVLKAARQPGEGGWLTSGSDQSSNTALEMAESQLARVLASRGILGIDKLMASTQKKEGTANSAAAEAEGTPSAEVDAPKPMASGPAR